MPHSRDDWLSELVEQEIEDQALEISNLRNRIGHASDLLDRAVIDNNYRAIIDIGTYRKIKELLRK